MCRAVETEHALSHKRMAGDKYYAMLSTTWKYNYIFTGSNLCFFPEKYVIRGPMLSMPPAGFQITHVLYRNK